MLNFEMIAQKLDLIRDRIHKLRELTSLQEQAFLKDHRNPASCENYLRHSLEAMFDIGRHILAKTGKLELSLEYKSIPKGLREAGIISKGLEVKLIQMAGYRNRIVHFYNELSSEELYGVVRDGLEDMQRFVTEIALFISSVKRGDC